MQLAYDLKNQRLLLKKITRGYSVLILHRLFGGMRENCDLKRQFDKTNNFSN